MFKKRKVNKSNLRTKEDELDQSAASGQTEGGEAVVVNLVKGNVGTSARGLSFNANSSKTTLPVSATGAVNIESDRSAAAHVYAGDATHTIEIDTAIERDYRSTLERAQQMKQQVADAANDGNGNNNITSHGNGNNDNSKETGNGEKVYKGTNAYDTYTNKDVTTALSNNKATGTMGPLRAPAFLRATVAIDYQPNVCKDYKETGTCGFGDTCIFLHDRSSLKVCQSVDTGWDVMQQKKRKAVEAGIEAFMNTEGADPGEINTLFTTDGDSTSNGNDDGNDNGNGDNSTTSSNKDGNKSSKEKGGPEELPFACYICRGSFTNPVVTLCNHYFCQSCILGYAKRGKCAVCGKSTKGVFNSAKKILQQQEE